MSGDACGMRLDRPDSCPSRKRGPPIAVARNRGEIHRRSFPCQMNSPNTSLDVELLRSSSAFSILFASCSAFVSIGEPMPLEPIEDYQLGPLFVMKGGACFFISINPLRLVAIVFNYFACGIGQKVAWSDTKKLRVPSGGRAAAAAPNHER